MAGTVPAMANGPPAAALLERVSTRAGLGLRQLHREINKQGATVGLTTLNYYWGRGKKVFKGRRLPADKPFLRAAREVLMSHGASQEDLNAIFGPPDGGHDVHQEIDEIRIALSHLADEVHDIKAMLIDSREKTPTG